MRITHRNVERGPLLFVNTHKSYSQFSHIVTGQRVLIREHVGDCTNLSQGPVCPPFMVPLVCLILTVVIWHTQRHESGAGFPAQKRLTIEYNRMI